jgi:hypothetical protein
MSFNNTNAPREGGNVWSAGSRGTMSNLSLLKFHFHFFSGSRGGFARSDSDDNGARGG